MGELSPGGLYIWLPTAKGGLGTTWGVLSAAFNLLPFNTPSTQSTEW